MKHRPIFLSVLLAAVLLATCVFAAAEGPSEPETPSLALTATITATAAPLTADTYTVWLKAITAEAPRLDGMEGDTLTLSRTGPGDIAFPEITFNDYGVFTYEMGQRAGSHPSATSYDATVYTITVYRPWTGRFSVVFKTDAGRKVNTIQFDNTYAETAVTATKVWDDANNQDGKRDDVTLVLSGHADQTVQGETVQRAVAVEDPFRRIAADAGEAERTVTWQGLPVYFNGEPIAYTVSEQGTVKEDGADVIYMKDDALYTVIVTGSAEEGFTVTNSHTPDETVASVRKIWNDANDQDGIRPASLTVTLSNGTKTVAERTLDAAHDWTAAVDGLPKYKDGKEIVYTWTEEDIEGYPQCSSAVSGMMTILTNTHETEQTIATVIKEWDDNNDQDALRPASLTVTLSNGNEIVAEKTLDAEHGWTATVEGLPRFAEGKAIVYTWTEAEIEYYTPVEPVVSGTTTTLKNTHPPEETEVSVEKIWVDGENSGHTRPASLVMTLSNGQTVTLSQDNAWHATVQNLPKYNHSQEPIVYTWTEAEIPGYEKTGESAEDGATTFTNTLTDPENIRVTGTKTWIDGGKVHDNANEIVLTLTRTSAKAGSASETVNATPTWTGNTYAYENLENYDAEGYAYTYAVTEARVPGYEAPVQHGYNFTNRITDPKDVDITGTKTWVDGGKEHDNASEITLTLTRTANSKSETVNVTPVWSGNTYTYSGLDRYDDDGYEYTYSVSEAPITGYTTEQNGYDFINTIVQEELELTVRKVWQDADDQDGIRPASLTVTLSDGQTVTLSAENDWSASIADLPRYDETGAEITYTWSEPAVAGYESMTEIQDPVTTLTNAHVPETTSLTVIKVWDDADDRDGIRPDSVTAVLSNGMTVTLNEENEWRATVEDLPVYDGGEAIAYAWTEEEVPGYQLTVTVEDDITTLTNTHDSETVTLTVTKVWNDVADQDGIRPAQLVMTLQANGEEAGTVTLSPANGWTAALDNLPINRDGAAIAYTWTEPAIVGYTQTGMAVVGNMTIITNTHVPETLDLTVTKLWEDNGNPARPTSLTVILSGGGQVRLATLSAANNWTATATGLPRYANGQPIAYTWTEPAIDGYTLTSQVTTGNTTVITNTRNAVPPPAEHTLTVYYRYLNGNQAAPTVVEVHKEGDIYRVDSPVIPGYTATILVVTGTMPGYDVEYTVIYIPNGNTIIIEEPDTPLGLGQVFINVGDCLE